MYLTHYGRVENVQELAGQMIEGVSVLAGFGEKYEDDPSRRERIENAIRDWLMAGLRSHGVTLDEQVCLQLLDADIRLNAEGICHWLDYRKR